MFALLKVDCGLYKVVEILYIDLVTNNIRVGMQHTNSYSADLVAYDRVIAWNASLVDTPWLL